MARRDLTAIVVLVVFLLLLGVGVSSQTLGGRAEPAVTDLQNGNKTVVWDFSNPADYSMSGVETGTGGLSLRRITSQWLQDKDSDFTDNGTTSPQVVVTGGTLRLRGNEGNLLGNGDFATAANWTVANSPGGSVTALVGSGTAAFSQSTPSESVQFDSLDTGSSWGSAAGPGASSVLTSESSVKKEGAGSLKDTITLGVSTGWAGIYRSSSPPWNFAQSNQISVWLQTTEAGPGLSVILHLESGFNTWDSSPLPVGPNWTRLDFSLADFETYLASVNRMEFRFTGVVVLAPGPAVYIDDIWARSFKTTNRQALITQDVSKATTNTGSNGSAILLWDYTSPSVLNVAEAELEVSVRDAAGLTMGWTRSVQMSGSWATASLDVSPVMAPAGTYTVTVSLRVRLFTDLATEVLVQIDNVNLISPDYQGGAYVSIPLNAGSPAAWGRISWEGGGDPGTGISVDLRSGGSPVPDSTWSYWTTYTNQTGQAIAAPPNTFLQFRVRLETSHSARTPLLSSLRVEFSKYVTLGQVVTSQFDPPERLVMWHRFDASAVVPAGTEVSYEISSDGLTWRVFERGDLRDFLGEAVHVRATLQTANTLQSPQIESMWVTYEVEISSDAPGPTDALLRALVWPWSPIGIAAAAAAILVWEVYFRYPHTLEDVFVISRDGRLIAHKTRRLRADRDEDVFAAMLAAIAAFVRESFKEERKELREFSFGDRTVYVERGGFGYVAAIYGDSPPWVRRDLAAFVKDLEQANGDVLQAWSGSRDEISEIAAMTEIFASRRRYVGSWRKKQRHGPSPGTPAAGRKPAS